MATAASATASASATSSDATAAISAELETLREREANERERADLATRLAEDANRRADAKEQIAARLAAELDAERARADTARRAKGLENMDGAGASNWVRNKHGSALVQKTRTSVGWLFSWADLG